MCNFQVDAKRDAVHEAKREVKKAKSDYKATKREGARKWVARNVDDITHYYSSVEINRSCTDEKLCFESFQNGIVRENNTTLSHDIIVPAVFSAYIQFMYHKYFIYLMRKYYRLRSLSVTTLVTDYSTGWVCEEWLS